MKTISWRNDKLLQRYNSFSRLSSCAVQVLAKQWLLQLRGNITIVNEQTVCATSAFSMCTLRVAFNVVLF